MGCFSLQVSVGKGRVRTVNSGLYCLPAGGGRWRGWAGGGTEDFYCSHPGLLVGISIFIAVLLRPNSHTLKFTLHSILTHCNELSAEPPLGLRMAGWHSMSFVHFHLEPRPGSIPEPAARTAASHPVSLLPTCPSPLLAGENVSPK